jgi:hypothetical protein
MNVTDRFAMDAESKRETARLEAVKRIAELEAALRPFAEEHRWRLNRHNAAYYVAPLSAFARAAELVKE